MMVKKLFKYPLLIILSFFLYFSNISVSYAQFYRILSHEYLLDLDKYEPEVQQTILDLESQWKCSNNRSQLLLDLQNYKVDDVELKSYIKLLVVRSHFVKSNVDSSFILLDQYELESDFPFKGRLYFLRADFYHYTEDYSQVLTNISLAEKIFEKNNDEIGLINVKISLLTLYSNIDEKELALESYLNGLSLCQKYNNNESLANLYIVYAKYAVNWDVSFAHEIFFKGWELAQDYDLPFKFNYAVNLMRFLLRYGTLDEFDEIYSEINPSCGGSCYNSYCSIISTFYAHRMSLEDKIDSARYYNQIALEQRKKYGNRDLIGYSYLNLAGNSMELRHFDEAKIELDSARNYLYYKDVVSTRRYYYQYLLKYYSAIDNKELLIKTYSELSEIESDFYSEQQKASVSKLNAVYDLQSKLELEKFEAEVKAQKNRFWYVLVITILLLIILMGLLRLYSNKSRSFNMLKIKSYSNYKKIRYYEKEVDQLKSIFQNDITGFFILDKDERISYANARGERLLDSSFENLVSRPISDFLEENYVSDFEDSVRGLKENENNREIQVKIKNSKDLWVNFSISPLYINNALESILVIALDVSVRVKALELEKEQRTILQTLFNSITESIILLDGKGIIELINKTGAQRLGKSSELIIGEDYFNILPEEIRNARVANIRRSIKERKAVVYSENIGAFHTLVSIFPNFNKEGEVDFIAEFAQDITDRRLAHEQINSLRQKVLRSQMNPHFIFNSLNAIQSYVLKNDTDQAVRYLNSFAKLIRMILDGSRFDYISLRKEIHLLEYYLQLQQLRFGDKFTWTLEVDKKIDTDSCLIPVMLAQPFIENAIEHGLQQLEGKGSVKISYTMQKEIIVFKVSDNGIGREASRKIQENSMKTNDSLSTNIFKERLFTLNKYSGQKITYDIIDLKDADDVAKGTMVVINIPITYRSNII